MPSYKLKGEVEQGLEKQPFEREIEAESEKHAKDKLYSQLTGEHSINRTKISLDEVEEQ
ncbi:MAG: 50S ribosomal protein L18Ae [Candidatus Nanohalobium sp.]